jgi:hypothetical protein
MQISSVSDLTALIIALATAVGTVGALVTAVSAKIKSSTHDARLLKLADDATAVGQLATAFAQKTAEQQGQLQTVAEVITNLSPEAKKLLADRDSEIQVWREKTQVADAQLKRLLPIVDGRAQANAIVDLPREKKSISAV